MTAPRSCVAGSCLLGAWLFTCVGIASCTADVEGDPSASFSINATVPPDARGVVYVDGESSIHLYARKCEPVFEFKKWSGAEWIPLQDDRPPGSTRPGYYLDGTFIYFKEPNSCEDRTCIPFRDFESTNAPVLAFSIVTALEYVQVGTKKPPPVPGIAAADAGAADIEVPVIETRSLSGRVEYRYFYYTDDTCESPRSAIATEVVFATE